MMKKIAALIGAGAILLSVAGPALAVWHVDKAYVENGAVAVASTGGNSQSDTAIVEKAGSSNAYAGSGGDRKIKTGDADAYAGALVVANTHVGCDGCVVTSGKDKAEVYNGAVADASTGDNAQDDTALVTKAHNSSANAGSTGDRKIKTGDSTSKARAWTIVNTHVGGL